jgi:hypothetical protein
LLDGVNDGVTLIDGRQHDDGQIAEFVHPLAEFKAIHAKRHVDVDDGQVR